MSAKTAIKKFLMDKFTQDAGGSELQKALLNSTTGASLIPYDLDPVLHEELLKLQPLAQLMEIQQANGKTHEYNVRTAHPNAWFEGENTPANPLASTYQRKTVALKIQRIWGGVTGFQQAVSAEFIDSLSTELEGSLEGMANLMEYGALWGSANDIGFTGDAYQYSGILPRLLAYAPSVVVDAGGDKISLDDLDNAIANVSGHRGVDGDQKLWLMSTRMRQIVDGLQTKVQIPLTSAVLADGKIVMKAYGDIPIYESGFISPTSPTTSPTVAAAAGGGTGTLPTDEYFYAISSVTRFGEQVAGTEGSASITGPDDIALTWTADANAVAYMIWRGLTTGVLYLLDIIPALTYDAAGTVNGSVATYTDNGSRTPSTIIKPLKANEHSIVLANLNPDRGAAFLGRIDDNGRPADRLFRYVPLAQVKDSYDYMLKGYMALKLVHPNLVTMIRHAKYA